MDLKKVIIRSLPRCSDTQFGIRRFAGILKGIFAPIMARSNENRLAHDSSDKRNGGCAVSKCVIQSLAQPELDSSLRIFGTTRRRGDIPAQRRATPLPDRAKRIASARCRCDTLAGFR